MAHDTILLVDDETDLIRGLQRTISMEIDCRVLVAENGIEALDVLSTKTVDVVLADIRMPQMDGLTLLKKIRSRNPAVTVIVMTAYGTIEKAVEAIKRGAYDFIQKPLDEERLIHLLKKGLELNRLVRENERLTEKMRLHDSFSNMVGQSRPMRDAFEKIRMLAQSDATVFIRGDTGTGKDLAAQAIHNLSRQGQRKMIIVNCPAIPETILESELFGYRKGAFTGAVENRKGLFDQAQGSSIFLDEIGDLSIPVQTKLLRVLQEKEIKPLGSNRSHSVDVRIIAATNQDIEAKIRKKMFREDLFYRLNVATLTMPRLDDIRSDIPLLVDHFLERVAREQKKPIKTITPEALNFLLGREWPGNIRELENLIRGVYAIRSDQEISLTHFGNNSKAIQSDTAEINLEKPYQELKESAVKTFTRDYLDQLLHQTKGNVSAAAQIGGMKRQSLQKIIKRYGLDVDSYRP
jgi:DNA-binding NtrC family response regulator